MTQKTAATVVKLLKLTNFAFQAASPTVTSDECLDEAQPLPAPNSHEDSLSQGARLKTTKIKTAVQAEEELTRQMHSAPDQSLSPTSDPEQHERNPKPETSATLPSDPVSRESVPFQFGPLMTQAAMPQGTQLVQYNVINYYSGQTSDHNHSTELYESQAFPQLLLNSLRPLDLEDWKMLASYLKLDKFIGSIESSVKNHGKSATQLLMDKWWQSRGNNVSMGEIKDALKKMTRIDILDEFTDALEEWRNQNN